MTDWNPIILALISTIGSIALLYLKQIHTAVNSNYTKITDKVTALEALQLATNAHVAKLEKDNAVLVEHIRAQLEAKNLAAPKPNTVDMQGAPALVEVVNTAASPVPVMQTEQAQ